MTIQHAFVKFVRLFHHQSFTLYGMRCAEFSSRHTVAYVNYFHHKLCSIATCCTCLFSPADLIRTIHNTYRLAMASVLVAAIVNKSALLLNGALGSSKLTLKCCLENYCAYAKFSQCHNSNPQSNFTQQPRINFLSCEPIHEIQENFHLGKITHYVKCEGHYTFDSVHRSTYPYHCW